MKRIALITDGWKRFVTYGWVDGIMKGAKEMGLDISLYQFNTNGNWSHDKKYNRGEYNLYTLPDYSEFDGVVFDGTNMVDQKRLRSIIRELKKYDIPVVSICHAVEGFYYVGLDNRSIIHEIMDHLYYMHDCRSFVFAGGPDYNYENQMRFLGYQDALESYGLELEDDHYMFGDFDFGTGVRYMDEWIEQKKAFPDAFVCANDNIAAGICSAAERHGYCVPKDFLVTGFDNLDKAAYFNPQITTAEHNRGSIGKEALRILNDIWNGKKLDPLQCLDTEIIFGESCGCPNSGRVRYRDYIKWQIEYSVKKEYDDEAVMVLESRMAECNDYRSLFKCFSEYIESLNCDGMYFVVDRKLFDVGLNTAFPTQGYDLANMEVGYAVEHGCELEVRDYKTLCEYMLEHALNTAYMYSPIHFRDQLVGFSILKNPTFLYDNSSFYDIHSMFVTKLENLYKQLKLQYLYNRDALTGLYNRVAYNEMIVPKYEEYNKNNISCAMLFFDVDCFKQINDTYGHQYGDEVLKKIAGALQRNKPENGFVYRFGGDEFVVFCTGASQERLDAFVSRVNEELIRDRIRVSHGIIITDPKENKSLEDYLILADKKMYEVKSARKQSAGTGFLKGVDISSLPEHIDGGERYYTAEGECVDAFDLLAKNNINAIRLRIWNEPQLVHEAKGYCNLAHTIDMAKQIKAKGMFFMLDFHYSDYWADPGQQRKPAAWKKLSFEELQDAVYSYTRQVLDALGAVNAMPDMVQIGNEIRSGMLFPDGEVPHYDRLVKLVNAGIQAVRDTSPNIMVMTHLDQGGRFFYQKEWYDAMFAAGMKPIDAIGISFYSFWHGTFMDLKSSMEQLIERYQLPVYIVETAHPWRHCENEHVSDDLMKMAGLPAGQEEQKKALELIMQIASEVSKLLPTGVFYWEPLCAPGKTYGSWDENMGMLDVDGKALCSFEAYRDFNPMSPPFANLTEYMEGLYHVDESRLMPAGTNLIPNGDFKEGLNGWWATRNPAEVTVREEESGIYISSAGNFTFELSRDVYIQKAGTYRLTVAYRGTNTTGVKVKLFLKTISCNGQKEYAKEIFPSDVDFVTHQLEDVALPAGQIRVGIRMEAPPIFGRIKSISLFEV